MFFMRRGMALSDAILADRRWLLIAARVRTVGVRKVLQMARNKNGGKIDLPPHKRSSAALRNLEDSFLRS
jgi:hypothetical protein